MIVFKQSRNEFLAVIGCYLVVIVSKPITTIRDCLKLSTFELSKLILGVLAWVDGVAFDRSMETFLPNSSHVKVDVEGTLSVGKDVLNTLSHIFENSYINTRRSMMPLIEEDSITNIVRSALFCRDINFCKKTRIFLEEYLIVLARSISTILGGIMGENFKPFIYEGQLKKYLEIIRNILHIADTKINEENLAYFWIHVMKKICAKFQELASILVAEDIQMDVKKSERLKKQLNQKIIIATVVVEMKYQIKLCLEHEVCITSYEVTKSLQLLLEKIQSMPDEKVRLFIRYFYEALFDTPFYSHISDGTAHEMQIILNDMAYSGEIPTKELLSTVQKIAETRLEAVKTNKDTKLSYDALLLQSILSDMDHFYSIHKADPFRDFFQHFYEWMVGDVQINKHIRLVIKDIGKELWTISSDLSTKLVNEVRVFLELTIGPDK